MLQRKNNTSTIQSKEAIIPLKQEAYCRQTQKDQHIQYIDFQAYLQNKNNTLWKIFNIWTQQHPYSEHLVDASGNIDFNDNAEIQ